MSIGEQRIAQNFQDPQLKRSQDENSRPGPMKTSCFNTATLYIGAALCLTLQPAQAAPADTATCWMNKVKQVCTMSPAPHGGFQMEFSAGDGPIFVFTPIGAPTTLTRPMRDAQGRRWLMTGNRSFTLKEVGGDHNVIVVSAP